MSRRAARALAVLVVTSALWAGTSGAAWAHPLGNASTNLASQLRVEPDRIVVDHITDLAEIRTVQLLPSVDTDDDGHVSPGEASSYAATSCRQVAESVTLAVGGRAQRLTPDASSLRLFPGQGGLQLTRLECRLSSPVALDSRTRIEYRDASYPDRFGWREVTAVFDGTTPVATDVPAESRSKRLRDYPEDDARTSVPDVRSAVLEVVPGGPRLADEAIDDAVGTPPGVLPGADRLTAAVSRLIERDGLSLGLALGTVVLAVVLGAGHALAPGHGKTVMAAYLVGQEGTRRQAVLLGAIVTFTHTAGVLLLGLLLLAYRSLASERLLAGMEIASGLLLAAVGVYLAVRAVARRRIALRRMGEHEHEHHDDAGHGHAGHGHSGHGHAGHGHSAHGHAPSDEGQHADRGLLVAVPNQPTSSDRRTEGRLVAVDHDHGFGRHTHVLPDPATPLGARALAAMGIAGGLVPSPSALVVLLAANSAGHATLGVLLVAAYGVGMAITLTLAGLALLRARLVLDRSVHGTRFPWLRGTTAARILAAMPMLTAGVIVLVGAALVLRGGLTMASFG